VEWGPAGPGADLTAATSQALRAGDGRGATAWLAPDEVDEMRLVTTYLASHDLPGLDLGDDVGEEELAAFADPFTRPVAV
jgi:hypothetical protein